MSLCRCWETSNRLRLRRRLTVVRNSSPGSNILKTNLPSTPSAIRWPITTSLGYGQSSGLQTCAGDGARGLDQVGLQHRLLRFEGPSKLICKETALQWSKTSKFGLLERAQSSSPFNSFRMLHG